MSSTDEGPLELPSQRKKRKITRACDVCRHRKIRCDERAPLHGKCSYCVAQDLDCTYTTQPKKRGRPKGYADVLERRIQLLERLVKKLCPNQTMLHSFIYPLDPEYATQLTNIPASTTLTTTESSANTIHISMTPESSEKEPSHSVLKLIHKIASLSLGSQDDPFRDDDDGDGHINENNRFFGKSSGAMLVRTLISLKGGCLENAPVTCRIVQNGRLVSWKRLAWEKDCYYPRINKHSLPPPDLIAKLTCAYFEHVNLFYPLLHRPTFERAIDNGLHLRDEGFESVLLLVCAVGSQYTEQLDSRTLSEGKDSQFSAGWKWFKQVRVFKQYLFDPPTLYDLQAICLATVFLSGCYAPQAVWILTGFGIRLAQDVGAHRRRVPLERLTVGDELWKRAFWVLVALDRMISMGIGRPCAILDDHFDVDMPVECDDEYWEHPDPTQRFRQPKDILSTVTAFNQHLRLYKIVAFAMSTIYSIKTKFWELILQEWEQHILAELDSALNNWMSMLPDYLRWDPDKSDDRFFRLSGSLITTFHYVQTVIHRPYSAFKSQPTPLSTLPSLAICRIAARSCSIVLEQQMKRTIVVYPYMQIYAFKMGLVLLLNIWGSKRSGVSSDPSYMAQVENCMNVLTKAGGRWRCAGILVDILNGLTTTGQVLLPSEEHTHGSSTTRTSALNTERLAAEGSTAWPGDRSTSALSSADLYALNPFLPMVDSPRYQFSQNMGAPGSEIIYPGNEQQVNVFADENHFHDASTSSIFEHAASAKYIPLNDGPVGITEAFPLEHMHSNSNIEVPTSQQQTIIDGDTTEMWINIPNGFEPDEWSLFFANFTN
ncbi:fungal-specific transcription factor domain-containing protein [Cyathus striatus]|nr:fungal-specific transcription factor domain-containing protein [Cyathus striatus]